MKHGVWLVASFLLLTTGCQGSSSESEFRNISSEPSMPIVKPENIRKSEIQIETVSDTQTGGVTSCQRELVALSQLNTSLYTQKKQRFDELLARATVYTGVRNDIGSQTKDTLDALYKYKTQKLCSEIEHAVRQSLLSTGEEIK